MNPRIQALIQWEQQWLQRWLDSFSASPSGRRRRAMLARTCEYLVIERLPLPDGYVPDEVDALLLVDQFPTLPPIGIYLLNRGSERIVQQISRRFNAFRNTAFHSAPAIEGYTWICFAYADNQWRYNATAPHRGDNLAKFLGTFFAEAAA